MDSIDKNKLNNLLDKKLSKNDIEELSIEIIKKVKDLKKREKNKKRKEQLDFLEKKYDLKILNKDQINKIPDWIKKNLKECKVIGKSKKIILTKDGKKFHLDNKLNDLTGLYFQ